MLEYFIGKLFKHDSFLLKHSSTIYFCLYSHYSSEDDEVLQAIQYNNADMSDEKYHPLVLSWQLIHDVEVKPE